MRNHAFGSFQRGYPKLTANINFHLCIQLRYAFRGWVLHPPKQQLTWDYEAPAGSWRLSNYLREFFCKPLLHGLEAYHPTKVIENLQNSNPQEVWNRSTVQEHRSALANTSVDNFKRGVTVLRPLKPDQTTLGSGLGFVKLEPVNALLNLDTEHHDLFSILLPT